MLDGDRRQILSAATRYQALIDQTRTSGRPVAESVWLHLCDTMIALGDLPQATKVLDQVRAGEAVKGPRRAEILRLDDARPRSSAEIREVFARLAEADALAA